MKRLALAVAAVLTLGCEGTQATREPTIETPKRFRVLADEGWRNWRLVAWCDAANGNLIYTGYYGLDGGGGLSVAVVPGGCKQ